MSRIEILQRGDNLRAQFRADDGKVDAICGSWDIDKPGDAIRDLQEWKAQVKRADIKQLMPKAPAPKPEPTPAPKTEMATPTPVTSPYEKPAMTPRKPQPAPVPKTPEPAPEEDHSQDSSYTVGELMDMKKRDLKELADSLEVPVGDKDTKAVIAQNIVNKVG